MERGYLNKSNGALRKEARRSAGLYSDYSSATEISGAIATVVVAVRLLLEQILKRTLNCNGKRGVGLATENIADLQLNTEFT